MHFGFMSLVLCLVFSEASQADVFGGDFQGKIKALAVDSDVRIKVVSTQRGQASRVVKLCEGQSLTKSARKTKRNQLALIKKAMSQGQTLNFSYRSFFDRCLRKVQIVRREPFRGRLSKRSSAEKRLKKDL